MDEGTREWLLAGYGQTDDTAELLRVARELEDSGEPRLAASAYDRCYAALVGADDTALAGARRALLDRLAATEHGMTFRYVPAGTFLMGSEHGDPDESPVHAVRLEEYWLADTPVSWAAFCDLMNWEPPPKGHPDVAEMERPDRFDLAEDNKVRLQYCENATTRAVDWHAHFPHQPERRGDGKEVDLRKLFGEPPRSDPGLPWGYDLKPMVNVAWRDAEALCERLSTPTVRYCLPTEAEWERAARGGLADRRYPWGDEPPTPERCDFWRFDEFSVKPMRAFPPNDYGLYGMAGSVWEWTADWYDAEYYRHSPRRSPTGPDTGRERVIRGGSWADCAEAVSVSFRMSSPVKSFRRSSPANRDREDDGPFWRKNPNVGLRLCRKLHRS